MLNAADVTRHAARRLLRAPAFALAASLTLTLGIGGAAAVFTMVDGVLLRPMPYDHPDQLVDLSHTISVSGLASVDQSDATYLLYHRDNQAFADIGAYRSTAANFGAADGARADAGVSPVRIPAVFATASVFRVLRTSAQLGRTFTADDEQPGAPPVVLLGRALWQRDFGGDAAILGRRVLVDGVSRQVVGVLPESFHFPDAESALWIPLMLDAANTKSAAFDFRGIGRLRDGVSLATAAADLQRILPHVPEVFPGRLSAAGIAQIHMRAVVRPLRDVVVGDVGRILWIVLGAVGVLLLVSCANVANLFLARIEGRQRELSIRRALGAGRGAILSELLSEATLIAAVGGALGLAVASAGVHLLQQLGTGTSIPRLAEVHVDVLVVAVTAGLAALAALVVSAIPVTRLEATSLSAALMSSGRSATTGRVQHRARRALVVAQVALALVLLAAAGLIARSFSRLRSVDPGFVADHSLAFRMSIPPVTYPTTRDIAGVVTRALDALTALPGVTSAGVITKLPLDLEGAQDSAVFVEDHPLRPGDIPGIHEIDFATPGYFSAMRIPITSGRLYAAIDAGGLPATGPPEVVVSEAFHARYWPGEQAVGKRVRMNPTDPWHTVVGVVGNVHTAGLDQPPKEVVYSPLVTLTVAGAPWIPRDLAFVVRTTDDPSALAASARRVVSATGPTIPTYRMAPVSALLSHSTARTAFTLLLLGIAGTVATLIGAVGIYGVISYLVSLRTREIGVRLALGADASHVRRLVASQAMTDGLIGVALGLAGTALLTRSLRAVLFDVSPTDPLTMAGASLLLLGTALAASWIPARRAARLDPAIALRSE